MATFAEMNIWVSKRLQDPNYTSVSSADVGECINMALDCWKSSKFYFNEIVDNATLLNGNSIIPLPSDYLCPSVDSGAFVIEYSGKRRPLKKISEALYNQYFLTNGFGQPWYYSKQATDGYSVYPVPDRDYDLLRFYLKDYADFVNPTDQNDFSIKAKNLLQYTAAAYASRDFRQDLNMYQAFWNQALQEEKDLLRITNKSNATGSLTLYSLL